MWILNRAIPKANSWSFRWKDVLKKKTWQNLYLESFCKTWIERDSSQAWGLRTYWWQFRASLAGERVSAFPAASLRLPVFGSAQDRLSHASFFAHHQVLVPKPPSFQPHAASLTETGVAGLCALRQWWQHSARPGWCACEGRVPAGLHERPWDSQGWKTYIVFFFFFK